MLAAAHQSKISVLLVSLINFAWLVILTWPCLADDVKIKSSIDNILSTVSKPIVVAVRVVDLRTGAEVYARNASLPLKPASTLKILTSAVALSELGGEFYYHTPFLLDYSGGKSDPFLYVKGVGDPYLTTEFLWMAARKIKKIGVESIEQILIDETAYIDPPGRQGQRSYMTGASAMSFNFNSVVIEACPSRVGEKAIVSADPWEADIEIESSVITSAKGASSLIVDEVSSGGKSSLAKFKVSGKVSLEDGCKTVNRSISRPDVYFVNTLEGFLKYLGIKVKKKFEFADFPYSKGKSFSQSTYPLSYVIKGLNHYSTNFIAEQLLYTLGADQGGKYFDRYKGIQRLESYLDSFGYEKSQFSIHDGSGLSHDNRLSVEILTKILQHVFNNIEIRNEFLASLPIAGVSGTVKKRGFDTSSAMIRAKTGSLDGVNTLAGFILSSSQKQYAFAIIQNQVKSRESALALEEKIVDAVTNN